MACLLSAPSAQAAFLAEGKDPAGDATTGQPGHDIVGFGLAYDMRKGILAGAVRLAGNPSSDHPAILVLIAGMRSATGCAGHPSAGFVSYTDSRHASWVTMSTQQSSRNGSADKTGMGRATQGFEALDRQLRGKRWNCLFVAVTDPDDANIVYDSATVHGFEGLAELAMRVPELKNPLKVGQTRRLKLTIRNPGDGPLRNLRLRVTPPRGVNVGPRARLIRRVKPRGKATVTVKVTMTAKAKFTNRLQISMRSGRLVAKESVTVERQRPKPKPRRGGGGGSGDDSFRPGTCVRYFPDFSGESGGSLGLIPC